MPKVSGILETAIYAEDAGRTADFYRRIFGFDVLVESPRLCALDAGERSVLLIFRRGATVEGLESDGGRIPPHDGAGPSHFAFAIELEDLESWATHLEAHGVSIESRVMWDRGGTSLYFRDPDNHSVELATRRTWATY